MAARARSHERAGCGVVGESHYRDGAAVDRSSPRLAERNTTEDAAWTARNKGCTATGWGSAGRANMGASLGAARTRFARVAPRGVPTLGGRSHRSRHKNAHASLCHRWPLSQVRPPRAHGRHVTPCRRPPGATSSPCAWCARRPAGRTRTHGTRISASSHVRPPTRLLLPVAAPSTRAPCRMLLHCYCGPQSLLDLPPLREVSTAIGVGRVGGSSVRRGAASESEWPVRVGATFWSGPGAQCRHAIDAALLPLLAANSRRTLTRTCTCQHLSVRPPPPLHPTTATTTHPGPARP